MHALACSAVHMHGECNNYILTLFNPAPCDKKWRSEHQTLFSLFGGGGLGTRLGIDRGTESEREF